MVWFSDGSVSEYPADTKACSVDDFISKPYTGYDSHIACSNMKNSVIVAKTPNAMIACFSTLECDDLYSLGPVYKKVC